jgi:hypothetical protein
MHGVASDCGSEIVRVDISQPFLLQPLAHVVDIETQLAGSVAAAQCPSFFSQVRRSDASRLDLYYFRK